MSTGICSFSFQISRWNMVCDKVISVQDWQLGERHWREHSANWKDFSPELAFLPAIKRRRLSDSARLFFESAWEIGESRCFPVVYASSNSEINRNFALWHSLLQENEVSPTSFSLSVHNALVGQWSELCRVKSETTSIMAQKDNLEAALLEGCLLLHEGCDKVLVVAAETPLYEQYNVQPVKERLPFAYALAMVVEKGEEYTLTLHSGETPQTVINADNALTWVQNRHLGLTRWQTPANAGGYWLWQKN